MKRSTRSLVLGLLIGMLIGVVGLVGMAQTKTTITFWHTYSGAENKELVKVLIPEFEAANPGIDVKTMQLPYDEFHRKLITSMAGGVAPDLARMDIIWVPEFADMGALAPLDQNFAEFQAYAESTFAGPLTTCYWNGFYYGLPLDTNTRVLYWNKEMFNAAGIQGPPSTWAEFKADAEALTKDTNGDGEIDQWGFAMGGTYPWATLPWLWSGGGMITDPEVSEASDYLDSPKSIAALQFIVDLYKAGAIAPTVFGGGIGTYDGLAQNKYAMLLSGPWIFPITQGMYPDLDLHPAPFPAGPGGSISVVGGEDVVIFQQSDHKEAAWKFVQFMLSEEVQLAMAKVGQVPVLKSVIDTEYMKTHQYYPIYLEQLQTAKARTSHPAWQEIRAVLIDAVESAMRGVKTPEQALTEAAKKIDQLLK